MIDKLTIFPPLPNGIRGTDAQGSGHFGAPRRGRRHRGADYVALAGDHVRSPIAGRVNRLGYCYADDPRYRLIEIVSEQLMVRVLYVEPAVVEGAEVEAGQVIGTPQDLRPRYPGITPHVHLDVILRTGVLVGLDGDDPPEQLYIDPEMLVGGAA